jgi:protein-tyrosine-phosphatase
MVDWSPRANKLNTVLFLCTGNYYRSRFAEELFNHHADRAGLSWIAHSRGLALERGAHNVGPISQFALHALKELEIAARAARPPTWQAPTSWLRSRKRNIGH